MPTREIPKGEWTPFFDFLSGMAQGWLVTLEVAAPKSEPRVRAYEVPLADIRVEPEHDCITVVLHELSGDLRFPVRAPRAVRLTENPTGSDNSIIELEAETGATTRLSFRNLPLPTQIDGLLA